jgi:hypothetical protein
MPVSSVANGKTLAPAWNFLKPGGVLKSCQPCPIQRVQKNGAHSRMNVSNYFGNHIKLVGFAVWGSLMVAICVALTSEDKFFATTAKPIASIADPKKNVTFRTEDDISWRPVKKRQGFFDGDRISTGPSSSATIDFGEGKKGFMGPDTIVSISSITQTEGKSYIVNLVKGAIKPVVPAKAKNQIIVTSGLNTYFVEPGQERGFAKQSSGVIRELSHKERLASAVKTSKPSATPKVFIVPQSTAKSIANMPSVSIPALPTELKFSDRSKSRLMPKIAAAKAVEIPSFIDESLPNGLENSEVKRVKIEVAPEVKTLRAKLLPKKPEASLTNVRPKPIAKKPVLAIVKNEPAVDFNPYVPSVVNGSVADTYVLLSSLNSLGNETIEVGLQSNKLGLPSQMIGVQVRSGTSTRDYFADAQDISVINLRSIHLANTPKMTFGGIPCAFIGLSPLVKGRDNSGERSQVGPEFKKIKICSLHDAKVNLPLKISIDSFAPSAEEPARIAPYRKLESTSPISLTLTNANDYLKITRLLMNASQGFSVARARALTGTGIFTVKSGEARIQISPNDISESSVDEMMQFFNHDFTFKGDADSLYRTSGLSLDALRELVKTSDMAGKKMFIRSKGLLLPVSSEFLRERPEVGEFVQSVSSVLFTKRVSILSYSN